MAEKIKEPVKLQRPSIATDQIRKFEYSDKPDVIQFDVRFPEIIERTYVVRLDVPFTDTMLEAALDEKRAEAKEQAFRNKQAKDIVQQAIERLYPEPEPEEI